MAGGLPSRPEKQQSSRITTSLALESFASLKNVTHRDGLVVLHGVLRYQIPIKVVYRSVSRKVKKSNSLAQSASSLRE